MKNNTSTTQYSSAIATLQAQNIALQSQLDTTTNQLSTAQTQLAQANEKLNWWEEQYKLSRQRRFGKSSEKNPQQLSLFDELEMPENKQTPEQTQTFTVTRKVKTKGRNIDTSKLLREIRVHDLSDTAKQCGCGNTMHKMGEDKSEKLVYIPASLKVIEHVYPKYACRCCEIVKMQEKEHNPLAKSMATSSLITEIIVSKYEQHIPLYRRSQMFARNGIELLDNTLGNWVMQACDVLAPLGDALWEQVEEYHYLQVDETPVKVLDKDKKGYMWCYHSPAPENRFVLFDYHISRGSDIPTAKLASFQGLLQTDGYGGYNTLRRRDNIINIGCFAHCRRKFNDARKVAGKTTQGLAAKALQWIGKLYRIENQLKKSSPQQKQACRQQHAKPILIEFHGWLLANQPRVLPKSQLGNAFNYAIAQWSQLSAYIEHGEVNIDNNWVENQIRPFALGRKNWLFVGNERGGHAAALLYSLIQTCKINNINSRAYFETVLNQAAQLRRSEISAKSLLPQFIDLDDLK